MWLQGLSPQTLFLRSKCGILPITKHQCGKGVSSEKADVHWRCFPGRSAVLPMRSVLGPQKYEHFHSCWLTRDYVRVYFPGLCGVSENTMWHSCQDSTTTFPHVSLFTKCDDSAKRVPVRCCFSRTCFGPFRSIATSSFDRIYPGRKHFVGSSCWTNYVSPHCVRRVSLTLTKHLDACSTSIRLMWPQELSPHTLYLGLCARSFQDPYTQSGFGVPSAKADVHWRYFPARSDLFPRRTVLSPRKYWTFSFMHPFSQEMMFVDNSLDCVVSQRPLCSTLVRFPWPLSLTFPYSWWVMIVLNGPCTLLFLMDAFRPFRFIATSSFDRIYPGRKHFVGRGCWANCVSPCCVRRVILSVTKQLDSCSTSIRPMWIQGLSPHTLFLGSKCWYLPRPIHPMLIRGPQCKCWCSLEEFSWMLCFITNEKGAESPKILNLFIHAPFLTRDGVRWYFPGLCGVSETTMWHSRQDSETTFPHASPFKNGVIVLRQSLNLFFFLNFILLYYVNHHTVHPQIPM